MTTKRKYNLVITFLSIVLAICIGVLLFMFGTTEFSNYKLDRIAKQYIAVVNEEDEQNYESIVDWDSLKSINSDVCAWIKINNTDINFPIVQCADNEYYLKHTFDKSYTYNGNPFLDYQNKIDFSDQNSIIYGHNMRDGKKFGSLLKLYDNAETAKKNSVINVYTEDEKIIFVVVGAFYTNANPADDNGYAFPYNTTAMTKGCFSDFISHLNRRFVFKADLDLTTNDNFLMLSTCAYGFRDERFVVVAKKIENVKEIESVKYTNNVNPLYPQRYYDKRGIPNPYKGSNEWKQ